MEALTGVAVALLAIYDMCKAVDDRMAIEDIRLIEQTKRPLRAGAEETLKRRRPLSASPWVLSPYPTGPAQANTKTLADRHCEMRPKKPAGRCSRKRSCPTMRLGFSKQFARFRSKVAL